MTKPNAPQPVRELLAALKEFWGDGDGPDLDWPHHDPDQKAARFRLRRALAALEAHDW